jgi:hypothetical protein
LRVNYLKCRNSRKPEAFFLQYCEASNGLILADPEIVNFALQNRNTKVNNTILKEILGKELTRTLEKSILIKILMKYFACSDRTIESLLKPIIINKDVIKNWEGKDCILVKETNKRKAYYKLV